jgi:hypothetical protein
LARCVRRPMRRPAAARGADAHVNEWSSHRVTVTRRSIEPRVVILNVHQKELRTSETIDLKHVYVCSGIRILAPEA